MKRIFAMLLACTCLQASGQEGPTQQAQPIVKEGKLLYQSEMASWYGTDLFLETYKNRDNIGGYFSYLDGAVPTCLFFSKGEAPKVIGTISFDKNYDVKTAKVNMQERAFTSGENDLYTIRKIALEEIQSDSMFRTYENTSLNLIPLISEGEKKVYVLTGPSKGGVVIFGNDYLLTYDKGNKLLAKKQLHKNIIPVYYGGKEEEGKQVVGAMHSHLPETGDFMTATDICTLMLYAKFAKWKSHNVVSKKYLNIWNCETNQLTVLSMEAVEKMTRDKKD